ncbi:hypothetical protein ACVWYN_002749 [Pedobacter sp. UYP24]
MLIRSIFVYFLSKYKATIGINVAQMAFRFIFLTLTCLLLTRVTFGQQLNVASYNLRYDNKDDSLNGNGWKERYPVIAKIIQFNDFDVFGTQEGKFHMLISLLMQCRL